MPHIRTPRPAKSKAALALLLAVLAWPATAAVLPLALDRADSTTGRTAGVLAPAAAAIASGRWTGHVPSGADILIELHGVAGSIAGRATLRGVLPNASALPLEVAEVSATDRTLVFSVRTGSCANARSYGILTMTSASSARLDLQGVAEPITLTLSKVG